MDELANMMNINSIIFTTISLAIAGIIGFWCRDVPRNLYRFMKRQFTTTLYLTTQHTSFFVLIKWISENYPLQKFRDFKISNGKWGVEDNDLVIGYGGHIIRYRRKWLHILLSEKDSQGVREDKEIIKITKLGRSRKMFDELFHEISDQIHGKKPKVWQLKSDYWNLYGELMPRSLDSVFLEQEKRDLLLRTLNDFITREDWYDEHGIPYQLGILLYGNPGSGKSSLIRAIASHLKYSVYNLSSSQLHKLEDGLDNLPSEKSIIVIEDIDCQVASHKRSKNGETTSGQVLPGISLDSMLTITNLGDILNMIDGICPIHGRILIMTTNHIDKLDPALLRPGRIDLKLEMSYVNREILEQFLMGFYNKPLPRDLVITINENLTCADLQELVLRGYGWSEVIQRTTSWHRMEN